ncbi:transglutaminase domain-containing protein [Streptomyces clavuligerus]|nr:transglutaminase domain-containing protein [Streptomyces clavuligerus]
MSSRVRLALSAYTATLLAAGALLPLLEGVGWLAQAALLLGVQSGAGELARRATLARPLTALIQTVVGLTVLTWVFAPEYALLGLVPGPGSLQYFGELLTSGGQDISRYAIPAPSTDGIELMVIGGVLVIGLLVDTIAVTFRSAAAAGLPLLALYSIAAGLAGGGASALWFLLAASGYLLLLLAEGREQLSRWGRIFTAPDPAARGRKALDPGGRAPAPALRTGGRIGVLALGVALAVPAALPALDGGVLSGIGTGDGSGGGGAGGTISAVNPLVSLQDNLNQPTNREVLRYRTEAGSTDGLYLRIVALDQFDGTSWRSSKRRVVDVPAPLPEPQGLNPAVERKEIRTSISAAEYYQQSWLPMPYPATRVEVNGGWRFEPEGRTVVADPGEDTGGARYSVTSLLVNPTPQQLAEAPRPPEALRREYTKVPQNLPAEVEETARRVTRGAANDHERAVRLQEWFTQDGGFVYDTQVRSGTGVNAITRFLRQKQGFCIHFSFSMATMARTLGIPARVAVGFTSGTPRSDNTVSVGQRDAHAWPELYFEGVGWTRFEPTPSRGSQPPYTLDDTAPGGPSAPSAQPSAASQAPAAAPSASDTCPPELRRLGECSASAATGTGGSVDAGGSWAAVPLIVMLAAVVGWPLIKSTRRAAYIE